MDPSGSLVFLSEGTWLADDENFELFAQEALPRLRRALTASRGIDQAADAAAEALAWAWEHWDEVSKMDNPLGYLYRVGQSKSRVRRQGLLPSPAAVDAVNVEPGLVEALRRMSGRQRTAVWLIHGCEWRPGEAAEAMGISVSSVATHADRGLARLRSALKVTIDDT